MLMNTIKKSTDRRRHARAPVFLHGRYMLPDQREFDCTTRDISVTGAVLEAPELANIGERVIVYLDIIGRIDGTVVRVLKNGFALAFKLPTIKVERLADQLTWLLNRQKLGMAEDRRHERLVPKYARSAMTLPDGSQMPCRLIDISLSGAAAAVEVKPPLGTIVTIGKTPGRVVRVFETGVAIEFFRMIPLENFDEGLEL
jgi:hypothetical protein